MTHPENLPTVRQALIGGIRSLAKDVSFEYWLRRRLAALSSNHDVVHERPEQLAGNVEEVQLVVHQELSACRCRRRRLGWE